MIYPRYRKHCRRNILAFILVAAPGLMAPAAALPQQGADTTAPQPADQPITGAAVPCTRGRIRDFECANVELLAYLPNRLLEGAAGRDMWGWTDSATGREFLLLSGGLSRTAVVEVTDPVHPALLGFLRPGGSSVKVYRHYAFLTTENDPTSPGLRVFDLTQLREVKTAPSSPREFPVTARNDSVFIGLHTMALNPATGFLYGNGGGGNPRCANTVHIVDVRTPTQPRFVGCYTEPGIGYETSPGETHDSECVLYRGPDKEYHGRGID